MAEWRAPSGTRCWDVYGRNGWAESECGRTDKHDRHVWNHEHAWYGPYTCPGHPIYEGKHRL